MQLIWLVYKLIWFYVCIQICKIIENYMLKCKTYHVVIDHHLTWKYKKHYWQLTQIFHSQDFKKLLFVSLWRFVNMCTLNYITLLFNSSKFIKNCKSYDTYNDMIWIYDFFFFWWTFQYLLLSYIICIFHSPKIIIVKIGSKHQT